MPEHKINDPHHSPSKEPAMEPLLDKTTTDHEQSLRDVNNMEQGRELSPRYRDSLQTIINQTFHSVAHLANLLPTGTVLIFQLFTPIVTNDGRCDDTGRIITIVYLALLGLICFFLCFTDSFKADDGSVFYGVATPKGILVLDGKDGTIEARKAAEYRIKIVDFIHGFLSVLVFGAVAFFDSNVVKCFIPSPAGRMEDIIAALPIVVGVVCSGLFVVFPTTRHGIGFPVTPASSS